MRQLPGPLLTKQVFSPVPAVPAIIIANYGNQCVNAQVWLMINILKFISSHVPWDIYRAGKLH